MISRLTFLGRARFFLWDRYYTYTIRILLILVCLAVTFLYTRMLDRSQIMGLFVIVGFTGLAIFLAVYYNFSRAVPLLLVVSTLMHGGLSTGTGTPLAFSFAFLLLLVIIWFFRMLLVEKSWKILPAPANIPATIFIIIAPIALIWSTIFVDPQVKPWFDGKVMPRLMATLVFMLSPLAYLLYANFMRTEARLRFYVRWFLLVGGIFLVLRLINLSGQLPFLNMKGQFPVWVTVLAIAMFLFNKEISLPMRGYLTIIALGWLYVTIGLGLTWLSGWVPILLGIGVLIFLYSKPLFIAMLIITSVTLYIQWPNLQAALEAEQEESGGTRGDAAGNVMEIIAEKHTLFGTGPAGYVFYFEVYVGGFFQLSHNTYLDILAQTGIAGLASYILTWLAMGWMALMAYFTVPKGGFRHAFAAFLMAAWVISIVCGMLGDWVIPFAYTQGLGGFDYTVWHWLMSGMAAALYYESKALKEQETIKISAPIPSLAPQTV
jgi:hypothetical protein